VRPARHVAASTRPNLDSEYPQLPNVTCCAHFGHGSRRLTAARLANEIDKGLGSERAIVLHKTDKKGRPQEELVWAPQWEARLGYARLLKEILVPDQAPMGGNTFIFEIDSRIKVPYSSGLSRPSATEQETAAD